jgi:Flp pilus assembly protein TadG
LSDSTPKTWITFLALLTAALGLISAFVQYRAAQSAQNAAEMAVNRANDAEKLASEFQKKMSQIEANRINTLAKVQEKQSLCEGVRLRQQAVDKEFTNLQSEHGILLNSVRSCLKGAEADKTNCLITVCVGAAFFTNGNSDCISVTAHAASIAEDSKRERQSALDNQCLATLSTAETFFD